MPLPNDALRRVLASKERYCTICLSQGQQYNLRTGPTIRFTRSFAECRLEQTYGSSQSKWN